MADEARAKDAVELTFESAESIILKWDSTSSEETIFGGGNRHVIDQYLNAVDEIQRSVESGTLTDHPDRQSKAKTAIRIAVARLEHEFRNLLKASRTSLSNRFANGICEIDLIPSDAIADLRSIAERMNSAGYIRECVQACLGVRKSCVDARLELLRIEIGVDDVQWTDWENLEPKIRWRIPAARDSIRIVFASEKKLCEQIFPFLSIHDFCFLETVKGQVMQLLNFAGAISSTSPRSPEKLVKILELHDAMSELLPDIEAVLQSSSSKVIRDEAAEILCELTEAARGTWSMFVNNVLNEPSKGLVPGGTIHPMTRYVMNYLSLITDYEETMGKLIVSKPELKNSGDVTDDVVEGRTPLAMHLICIIMTLQSNLEVKSKHYKDPALGQLFMMNNVHYIAQKAKSETNLREMIGDGYLMRLSVKYKQFESSYLRSAWGKVMRSLREEGLQGNVSVFGISRTALKERFKIFNTAFDEVHKTQAMWVIPDDKIRQELRVMILELLVPAYTAFLGRFRNYFESGRHPESFVKYSVEDIRTAVFEFFEGTSASQQQLRRRNTHQ